jgi:Trp operon repressor
MMETFSRDLMVGMLRKGQTGDQILDILNVITSTDEVTNVITSTDEVTEDTQEVDAA